jgi:hypothetical protein
MLGLINMGSHGNNARTKKKGGVSRDTVALKALLLYNLHSGGVGLAWSGGRSMHDTQLGITQKVVRSTKTVQHGRSAHHGGVSLTVNIEFHGSIHGNDTQSTDDFRVVGNLLRAKQKLVL